MGPCLHTYTPISYPHFVWGSSNNLQTQGFRAQTDLSERSFSLLIVTSLKNYGHLLVCPVRPRRLKLPFVLKLRPNVLS